MQAAAKLLTVISLSGLTLYGCKAPLAPSPTASNAPVANPSVAPSFGPGRYLNDPWSYAPYWLASDEAAKAIDCLSSSGYGNVHGSVTDNQGRPFDGVTVMLTLSSGTFANGSDTVTVISRGGVYGVVGGYEGSIATVSAWKPGYLSQTKTIALLDNPFGKLDVNELNLAMIPADASVPAPGPVPSPNAVPVPKASALCKRGSQATIIGTVTDSKGQTVDGATVMGRVMGAGAFGNGSDQLVTTSVLGAYALLNAPTGVPVQVTVSKNGVSQQTTVTPTANPDPDPKVNRLDLTLGV